MYLFNGKNISVCEKCYEKMPLSASQRFDDLCCNVNARKYYQYSGESTPQTKSIFEHCLKLISVSLFEKKISTLKQITEQEIQKSHQIFIRLSGS